MLRTLPLKYVRSRSQLLACERLQAVCFVRSHNLCVFRPSVKPCHCGTALNCPKHDKLFS